MVRRQFRQVQRNVRFAWGDYRLHDLALAFGLIVPLGAAIDAEMEHQTTQDTTSGSPKPIGSRGAQVPDTTGDRQGR